MAAPATTSRGTPSGIQLYEGHSTKIAFSRLSTVSFWEKAVTPPSIDGGDEIDITSMFNSLEMTYAAPALRKWGEVSVTAFYDPNAYNSIKNTLINQEGSVTVHFPDGSTLDFFGYLKMFEPQEMVPGEAPEAEMTIVVTNFDPANRVEQGPVLTQVAGT